MFEVYLENGTLIKLTYFVASLGKLPAMAKTWRYVCTMMTHPKENTRRP